MKGRVIFNGREIAVTDVSLELHDRPITGAPWSGFTTGTLKQELEIKLSPAAIQAWRETLALSARLLPPTPGPWTQNGASWWRMLGGLMVAAVHANDAGKVEEILIIGQRVHRVDLGTVEAAKKACDKALRGLGYLLECAG